SRWCGLEDKAGHVAEDPVVRDERDRERGSRRGDPAVAVVLAPGERVAGRLAVGAELSADQYELGAGVDHLGPLDPGGGRARWPIAGCVPRARLGSGTGPGTRSRRSAV